MIAYLEGQIILIENNLIVLKTSNGVGYGINVITQLASNSSPEDFINLHIFTNVKEDEISLYGFEDVEQKQLFSILIKTSGVGPKLGLAVLSTLSPRQLVDAVHQNSTASFSQVPGIGEKTAAKLCLDLKDRLKQITIAQFGQESNVNYESIEIDEDMGTNSVFSALKNLGYHEKEIIKVLRESGNSELSFENRLKKALSLLTPLR